MCGNVFSGLSDSCEKSDKDRQSGGLCRLSINSRFDLFGLVYGVFRSHQPQLETGGAYLWMLICPALFLLSVIAVTICNAWRKKKGENP